MYKWHIDDIANERTEPIFTADNFVGSFAVANGDFLTGYFTRETHRFRLVQQRIFGTKLKLPSNYTVLIARTHLRITSNNTTLAQIEYTRMAVCVYVCLAFPDIIII